MQIRWIDSVCARRSDSFSATFTVICCHTPLLTAVSEVWRQACEYYSTWLPSSASARGLDGKLPDGRVPKPTSPTASKLVQRSINAAVELSAATCLDAVPVYSALVTVQGSASIKLRNFKAVNDLATLNAVHSSEVVWYSQNNNLSRKRYVAARL